MTSFLSHIVQDIKEDELSSIKDRCYVFPTRRACLHFNQLLTKRFEGETFFYPAVLSIEEFIQSLTKDYVVADELTLLFKLYKVYKTEQPALVFDDFYIWGQTLLKDFDEIDRYMVDGERVFQNLQEIQDIEATFGPNEEMQKAFLDFQEVINVSTNSKLFKSFQENWSIVAKVLPKFKQLLSDEGLAYMGACYKLATEGIEQKTIVLPYDKVLFVGFNALSISEERIIHTLLQREQAEVYFDADKYYLEDEQQEAGRFLRGYRKKWKRQNVHWVITDGFAAKKEIIITGSSQTVVQARKAAQVIENDTTSANNAIVMADESLLLPVLYALPEASQVNITMGYPITSSPIGGLITAYFRYQASMTDRTKGVQNVFLDVESYRDLITQPALKTALPILPMFGKSKSRWLSYAHLQEAIKAEKISAIKHLLEPVNSPTEALDSVSKAILSLQQGEADHQDTTILQEQIAVASIKYLDGLNVMLKEGQHNIDFKVLERIIRETLKQQKAPFMGEPLVGTQVMGFLETRTLDFDHLVLLSVNEDLLPSAGNSKTYLPFGLRKAFGLPTFIEHNSIYAYHFFRLLQRAQKISLIYNTALAFDGSGEKSRFILQLLQKLKNRPNIKLIEQTIITPISDEAMSSRMIEIQKTGGVFDLLMRHKDLLQEKGLSPTAFINYIECSLKYYMSRVLNIKPSEIEAPEIDARDFGNLLHNVMELVYTPYIGKEVSKTVVKSIIDQELEGIIDQVFTDTLKIDQETSEIKFLRYVISHLSARILEIDLKDAPFEIIDLESQLRPITGFITLNDGISIKLGGKIDRLDTLAKSELTRILDYKTGKFDLGKSTYNRKPITTEEYVEQFFKNPDTKSGFQTLFYAYLLHQNEPDWKVTGGIIGAKTVGQGVSYLKNEDSPLNEEVMELYGAKLKDGIEELFDERIPFMQTDDEKRCLYCDFKNICER